MFFENNTGLCLYLVMVFLIREGQMADSALKRRTTNSHNEDSKARKHQHGKYTSSFLRALKSPTLSLSKSKKYAVSYYNPSPYQSSYPSSYPTNNGYPYPSPYPPPYSYPYSPDAGYPGGYPAETPAVSPAAHPAPAGQSIHYHCSNSGSPRKDRTEKFEIKGKFFKSIGCWSDTSVRAIKPLEGQHPLLKDLDYRSRVNALMKCAQVSLEKNLEMFALQNGGQCFGDKNAEASFRKYGPSTGCCGDGEGGQWSNEVYSFLGNNSEPLVNASYNPWSSWSPCSQTCGNGNNTAVQTRNRTCFTSQVTYITPGCGTTTIETRPCGVQICPVPTTPPTTQPTTQPTSPMTQPTTRPTSPMTQPTTQPPIQSTPRPTPATQQPPAAVLIALTTPSTPSSVCTAKVDLGILIDGSGSIEQTGPGNFKRELNFVKQIVSAFEVSRDGTHVGIIIFSSDAKVVSGFDEHYDESSTLAAIDNIQYPRMGTNIGRALELARNNLYGKSARPGIPNMLIVLTDGQSQDPVTDAAQRLRDSAVTIFAVGIGNGYDIGQLRDMATDPDSQHVYKATFNNLDEVVKSIKDRACMGAGGTTKPPPRSPVPTISICKAKVDLAILVDGSGSIEYFSKGNFKRCLRFVKRLIRGFNIARDGTHVGIVVFSQKADVIFGFETYFSLPQILKAINGIRYPGRSTYTGRALDVVRTMLFDASARQGVPNILLVMTDGSSQDDIDEPSRKLRDMGVTVFSLGVGNAFDVNQLNTMATDPDREHVFTADFKQLGSSVIEKIKEKACKGSGGVLQPVAANRLPSGKRLKQCLKPLGMESKYIPDSQITASSEWNSNHGPSNARLNFQAGGGRTGAWSSKTNDVNQWLQVDLGQKTRVTGIRTQGRSDFDQWVTSFTVSYSDDGVNFTPYNPNTDFSGNSDRNTVVTNRFRPSILARYVRVHPKTWYGHISMRIELLGCASGYYTVGCFKDSPDRAIPTMEGKDPILDGKYPVRKNPIVKCAKAAWRAGYKMFAVQDGGWCAASATAPQTYNKHGRSTACKPDGEGGPWANQVYSFRRKGRFSADAVGEDSEEIIGEDEMKEQLDSDLSEQTVYEAANKGVLDEFQNDEQQALNATRQGEYENQSDSVGAEFDRQMTEAAYNIAGNSDAELEQKTTKIFDNTGMTDDINNQSTNLAYKQNVPGMSLARGTEPLKNDSQKEYRGMGIKASVPNTGNRNPVLGMEGTTVSDEQRTAAMEQMEEPGTLTDEEPFSQL